MLATKRPVLAMGLILLAGCGGDPKNDLLAPGSTAVLASEKEYFMSDTNGPTTLQPGVIVRVGHDPGPGAEGSPFRDVKVTVESGSYRNASGKIPRDLLRPAK